MSDTEYMLWHMLEHIIETPWVTLRVAVDSRYS